MTFLPVMTVYVVWLVVTQMYVSRRPGDAWIGFMLAFELAFVVELVRAESVIPPAWLASVVLGLTVIAAIVRRFRRRSECEMGGSLCRLL